MGSCETGWTIGPTRTLKLDEFERRKRLSSSSSSSFSESSASSPSSPSPSRSLAGCPDDHSINDDIITIEDSSDEKEGDSLEDVSSESFSDSSVYQVELESVSDNEWNIITIEDEEDDGDTQNTTLKQRICYRCPNKTQGTFRNEKLYFAHIKRHVLPDLFACPACQRPFLKFSHVLSHEIRVHEAPLECSIAAVKDSAAIIKAKQYMKSRKDKQTTGCSSPSQIISVTAEDEETDPEDTTFYDNRFTKSASIYPYRGPAVTSLVQCYEIKLFNPGPKLEVSNMIAQRAIEIHKENVKTKNVTNKLGNFSQRATKRRKILAGFSVKKRIRNKAPNLAPDKSLRGGKRCGENPSLQPACKKVRGVDGNGFEENKE